jgi:hypothetical protein
MELHRVFDIAVGTVYNGDFTTGRLLPYCPVEMYKIKLLKRNYYLHPLEAFAKFPKTSFSFVMSVHMSTWNISAPTGRIFVKLILFQNFSKICRQYPSSVKVLRITGTVPRPVYICNIWMNYS